MSCGRQKDHDLFLDQRVSCGRSPLAVSGRAPESRRFNRFLGRTKPRLSEICCSLGIYCDQWQDGKMMMCKMPINHNQDSIPLWWVEKIPKCLGIYIYITVPYTVPSSIDPLASPFLSAKWWSRNPPSGGFQKIVSRESQRAGALPASFLGGAKAPGGWSPGVAMCYQ